MIPKHTKHEVSFIVMPTDCNAMFPMIFGGAFWSKVDLAIATLVKRALYDSITCNGAVTHKSDVTFHAACELGDIVFINCKIVELRRKAIVIEAEAHKESGSHDQIKVMSAKFVFVSKKDDKFTYHGLELQ